MKILAFTDTHGESISHLYEGAHQADILICAGDITNWGNSPEKILNHFVEFAESVDKKIVIVHGNHDGILPKVGSPRIKILHKEVYVHNNLAIFGYGGGGFSKQDPEFEQFINSNTRNHQENIQLWLMHGPPEGLNDEVLWAGNTGCKTKRKMIDIHQPHLVISGHIHDTEGQIQELSHTIAINPGPHGIIIDTNELFK